MTLVFSDALTCNDSFKLLSAFFCGHAPYCSDSEQVPLSICLFSAECTIGMVVGAACH